MHYPKKTIKLRIIDYDKLNPEQILELLINLEKRFDIVHDQFKRDRFNFSTLRSFFSVILNFYYITKTIHEQDGNFEGHIRIHEQLDEIKKKLGIE
ncbi:MAG: hypothetical protein ACUZ8H_01550 [Candidatus Anammoxibacter sp.]